MSEQVVIIQNSPIVVEVVPPGAGNPVTASNVSVVDAGDYYTSTNVEGVLQEVGVTDVAQATAINTNTTDIATNANAIGVNTTAIGVNAGDISTNTSDIATNATAITTKVDTAGRALNKAGTTLNVDTDFTSTQYDSGYQTLTFGASVAWDMSSGQAGALTLTGDAIISNPTNKNSITPVLEVTQDGAGGHTLTFDTDFVEVDVSSVTTDANSVTVYAFVKGSDGNFRGQGKTFSL